MSDEMDKDFWDKMAEDAPVESTPFEELPVDVWFLGRTATLQNGGAAPKVRTQETKNGDMRKLSMGLYVEGGGPGSEEKHKGRVCFMEVFVEPATKDRDGNPVTNPAPLSGQMQGFLNTVFASGVGAQEKDRKLRSAERTKVTMECLRQVAAAHPEVNLAAYNGNRGRFMAGLAVTALGEQAHRVLFKTKLNAFKSKQSGEMVKKTIPDEFEDASPENMVRRGITVFAGGEDGMVTF